MSGYHTDDSPEFWVKLDNYDLQIRVFPDEVKFLEDEKEAIAPCQDSHNLTSAQESEPVFALQHFPSDGNLSESQKLMNTVAISYQNGSPMSATTVTCEVSQCEISENSGEKSTLLLPPVEELVFGAVVATADLTDCILMTEEFISQQSETELKCGLWEPGRYAWKLENIQIFKLPISAKGYLGLWNIELLIPSIE
ncbi:hypothetical protein [Nostoc sphaeroides]|uniref:PUA domain n=1 Tax=Nostoc sphaeroides CCNUC1 TaxID=2653204 RepID=A0A5P8WDD5_9NOSO|nr:hypothetical protein [Nostoc sphaeroides]QFS50630.1 PUA domain [Nostoc sphaeroides CCNUC1]